MKGPRCSGQRTVAARPGRDLGLVRPCAPQRRRLAHYASFAFTGHPPEAWINASGGTVGVALDRPLMEFGDRPVQTELLKPCAPWKSLTQSRARHRRVCGMVHSAWLHSAIGHVPPAAYYAQTQPEPAAGVIT
jgi:putative transposase